MPTIEEFFQFLSERCRTWEMVDNSKVKQETASKGGTKKGVDKRITAAATTSQVCDLCKEGHRLYECKQFLKLSAEERRVELRKKQLCINCMKAGHYAKDCRSSTCRKCSKPHNTLLHVEGTGDQESRSKDSAKETEISSKERSETTEATIVTHCSNLQAMASSEKRAVDKVTPHVILSTAQVYVRDREGNRQICRALLDPGSQSHFITEDLLSRLRLSCRKTTQVVNGIIQHTTNNNEFRNRHTHRIATHGI